MRTIVVCLWIVMMSQTTMIQTAAQTSPQRIPIRVREMAGLRRFGYPTTARVPFPQGALMDAKNSRLVNAQGHTVAAQITAVETHPDRSVKWLEVDMNLSPAPLEIMEFQLEYGAGVTHTPPTRGLTFSQTADTFQVSAYTIRKDGYPLVQSVKYGQEYLKEGGINVVAKEGHVEHRLRDAKNLKWTVEKQGAFQVRLRGDGEYPAQDGKPTLPFTLTLEFASSKSWIGITHTVRRADARPVTLYLIGNFNLSGQLLWDTDVGYGLYGVVNSGEEMRFLQTPEGWACWSNIGEQKTRYAASAPSHLHAKGWGHFQEAKEGGPVVAFGVARFGANGDHTLTMRGAGTMAVQYESSAQAERRLRIFFHFILVPMPRTAQTSPPSMMMPLMGTCPVEYYRKCGVPVPPEAP